MSNDAKIPFAMGIHRGAITHGDTHIHVTHYTCNDDTLSPEPQNVSTRNTTPAVSTRLSGREDEITRVEKRKERNVFLRKRWLPISVFVLAIVGVCFYILMTRTPPETVKIYKTVEPFPKSTAKAPVGDTSQGGHFHADGTWHAEPHKIPAETTPVTPPGPYFSEAELAAIPEDMPEPDLQLPNDLDLADYKVFNRWVDKHTAEWSKYVRALDPRIERLNAEIDQMMAELPPENSSDFTAAKAKLREKKEEHRKLRAERNARTHRWPVSTDKLFADYQARRANRK